MIETAENLARDFEIRREDADAFALRSHQRAAAAWNEGRFEDEVVAVPVPRPKGEPAMFARDETFRADASLDALAGLRTVMKDGTVTAGNASQQNDGAAACPVVAEEMLGQLRLTPEAVLLGWAAAGCEPSTWASVPFLPSNVCWVDCEWDSIRSISWRSTRRLRARCSRCSRDCAGTTRNA
jgi:acetyl-CoA C-acetyltransferase